MLVLNNKIFIKAGEQHPEAVGTYKALTKVINLYNNDGDQIGFINCYGVLGKSSKMENGQYWHQATEPKLIGEYKSLSQRDDEVLQALNDNDIEFRY